MKQVNRNLLCVRKVAPLAPTWGKKGAIFLVIMKDDKDNYCYHLSVLREQLYPCPHLLQEFIKKRVNKSDFIEDVKGRMRRKQSANKSLLDISVPKQLIYFIQCCVFTSQLFRGWEGLICRVANCCGVNIPSMVAFTL